jgi:hypothetical protein
MAGPATRALPSWIEWLVPRPGRDRVAALTGISGDDWREVAAAFPDLPTDPGSAAARARARLHRLAARAQATGRWNVRVEGEPPAAAPAVYVTAHLGALQALRYVLRARGIAAASVIGPFNLDRTDPARADRVFDRRHPLGFPHALPSGAPHRLRSALRTGSLIAAADLPGARCVDAPLLGGTVRLDPRPFRLARATGVVCRAIFLTLPPGGWTLSIGPALPEDEPSALEGFAGLFAAAAARAPLDLDGVVYRSLARRS